MGFAQVTGLSELGKVARHPRFSAAAGVANVFSYSYADPNKAQKDQLGPPYLSHYGMPNSTSHVSLIGPLVWAQERKSAPDVDFL